MKQISLPWMIEVIESLNGLDNIKNGAVLNSVWMELFLAKTRIEVLFDQSLYSQFLRVSRINARTLHGIIEEFVVLDDDDKVLDESECFRITDARDKFKQIFLAELSILPAYLVMQKGGHDTLLLIEDGTKLFPETLIAKVPETKFDAEEVGKALAFELSTACGFHAFRVVEAVLRRYWDEVSSGKVRPEPQTLGTMAGQLDICKFGDPKVNEALKQMTKLHRNPISHPDVVLNVDEAIAIIGMGRSVITHMLSALQDAPLTTGAIPQIPSPTS